MSLSRSGLPRRYLGVVVGVVGALIGVFVLHPLSMVVSWLEIRDYLGPAGGGLFEFVGARFSASFTLRMLPMTAGFAGIGGVMAYVAVHLARRWTHIEHARAGLARELAENVPSLMRDGESERVEFKVALRWDVRKGRVNKDIELASLKTIAGFANSEGGSLLLGVDDAGRAVGLARDYKTLRRRDRDGFEQHLFTLVSGRIGGDVCPLVHVVFADIDGQDVVRVVVEPAHRPVYVTTGDLEQFFVRAGNSTRQLGVREAVDYIAARWVAANAHGTAFA